MSLASEIIGRRLRLPEPETRAVVVERDIEIAMDDGVVLLANRYRPAGGDARPTILVRSPYGRGGMFGLIYGRLFAERGFQVVVQSVRGTFGSGGAFVPFDEQADGLATIAWIERQPWFDGRLAMAGASYLGVTQWAVAGKAGDRLGALALSATASQVHGQALGSGALSLETALAWTTIVTLQDLRFGMLHVLRAIRRLPALVAELPVASLDAALTGQQVPFFAEWMEHTQPDDAYWADRDFSTEIAETVAPAQFVGGWQDIFLPWMLADFVALQDAGREPQLVVGPWTHMSTGLAAAGSREALAWLRAHLLGDRRLRSEAPVRVFVGGRAARWRELDRWPPPAEPRRLHLHPEGALAPEPPPDSPPDRYRYDPASPTPSVGGPGLLVNHAVVDNGALEARADVLTYTTAPLLDDLEVIGPVSVEIWVRSSSEHFDVFARVCDVDGDGTSLNVCDALERVTPGRHDPGPDGAVRVGFELWPTAYRFAAGDRLRLQVSSGAHPRYARNSGTGEDQGSATQLVATDQEVLHDPRHPSAVVLARVA